MPPLVLFNDFDTTSPSASTEKPVIVTVPIVKSPEPSTFVAPERAPDANVAVPSVNEPPVMAPDALIVVAPAIEPVFVMPPLVLFNDLDTTSPSASTEKPVIVIVPAVKSEVTSNVPATDVFPVASSTEN